MKRKKLAIIGASYLQLPLIEKAKEMGYTTHVFAWAANDVGEHAADHFYPISIVEKEAILEKCREIQPDAVCTIASDLAEVTVNYVANALGLAANSPESIGPCTNKFEMREALERADVTVPKHCVVSANEAIVLPEGMAFPVIVKPTDRSGSRGIMKVERREDVERAVMKSAEQSFEKKAIIEEFIDGPEYSCESVSFGGRHHVIAVTKKFTTDAPHFIEIGHMEPSDLNEEQLEAVHGAIPRALDALHITTGISHSEFRMGADGVPHIIEIGARMGGDCIGSDLVMLSTGRDFLRMTIETALGLPPTLDVVCPPRAAAIRFVFSQKDVDVIEKIRREAPETIIRCEMWGEVGSHEVSDSSSRYGYCLIAHEDPVRVRKLIEL